MEATKAKTRTAPAMPQPAVGPTVDGAFIAGFYALALGMLALLGVLAIAGTGESRVLPFLALPIGLFIAASALFWRWGRAGDDAPSAPTAVAVPHAPDAPFRHLPPRPRGSARTSPSDGLVSGRRFTVRAIRTSRR
jgi:hypothetical protein